MNDLKSCPFCGSNPEINYHFGSAVISCNNQKCKMKPSTWLHSGTSDFKKLVKIWNGRSW